MNRSTSTCAKGKLVAEPYVPPQDGVPETSRDGFWFLTGWKWAVLDALENRWIDPPASVELQAHGESLAAEARRRRGGETT